MAANRVAWTIYANESKAREIHTYMLGRAAQARVLNGGAPTAEPGGGELHELVGGFWHLRERFTVTSGGAVADDPVADNGGAFWRSAGYSIYEDAGWAADAMAQCEALAQQAALLVTQEDAGDLFPLPTANVGSIHVCGHETDQPCVIGDSFSVPIPAAPSLTDWEPGTNYMAGGEERAYGGEEWINIRANNTQQLAPGTNSSGWLRKSNRPAPWYDVGTPYYPVTLDGSDMKVTRGGNVWRNTSANNSSAPGVFGWVNEGPA